MYAAPRLRPAIHSRTSLSAVERASDLLNRGDAHAVAAAWGSDLHLVADSVTDQRLAQRRFVADAAGLGVGLGGADDAVGLLVRPVLGEAHCAAHTDNAA